MPDVWGALGLWWHLRAQGKAPLAPIDLPRGAGPLLLIAPPGGNDHAAAILSRALTKGRADLRILDLSQVPENLSLPAAADLLAQTRPAALLLMGDALPAALIKAAESADVPIILANARVVVRGRHWSPENARQRLLMRKLALLLLNDRPSRRAARRMGVPESLIQVSGPITEIRDPLRCTEAERVALAKMLRGRHVWLAAGLPEAEEEALIQAHRAALGHSHRALLIVVPASKDRGATLTQLLEDNGFAVAQRSAEEEPSDEIQILVADDPGEMGLWYRLAPVTFVGGTLSGATEQPIHPFEPAALGSAIIHGPKLAPFQAEWHQLIGNGATRAIADPAGLAEAVADLAQPAAVAELATSAWAVSTGGAAVARAIAGPVLDLIAGRAA